MTSKKSMWLVPLGSTFGLLAAMAACSSAGQGTSEEPLAQGMGAIVATIAVVPNDVQCVEIRTSDYRTYQVRTDVTPGQPAVIRLAPLTPGAVYLYGTAYSGPCWTVGYGYPYYPYYDAGSNSVTWEADSTVGLVEAGRTNTATITFHKLGDLNVDVTFQEPCVCDADGVCLTVPQSGGTPQACSPVDTLPDGGVIDQPDVGPRRSDGGF